ncbi:LysR family transcriptional regulator [Peribacillus muralis]|uniref:LysR family transcriptional regulator n=1 Tax=Peribacillus muralis TaxID=264697 RepID=UPI001F4E1DCA|nr:LysR family transcriptional regulator [Peribacillus muralis]MCK1993711.1 LysR family transcriptional regulator [Peribacillus muralis]MCK2014000.1 LysR family transcriptional regulator [Peribacillus muralis]
MDLRQLRYFITIVEEMSYSKAAKILHISQPSLSNAIMKLERENILQLLERNTRGIELTEAGAIFYSRSQDLLRRFSNMQVELEEMKQAGSGTISIGLIESFKIWFPKIIRTFKRDHPKIHLKVREILGEEHVIDSLNQYQVHFTITNQPINDDKITSTPLYNEKFKLLVHKDDDLNEKEVITFQDLLNKELIISTAGFQTRDEIMEAFKNEKVTPNIFYEIERLETACSLVDEGLGVTILPESYIKSVAYANTATLEINSKFLQRTVYIAYLKDRYLPPSVYKLVNEIESFFKSKE